MSGLPILPLLSSKNMVVKVVVGETNTLTWQYGEHDYKSRMMALVKFVQKDMFKFMLRNTIVYDQLPRGKEMCVRKGEGCGPELSDRISQPGFQLERELRTMFTVCYAICMGRWHTSPTTPC